jgi:hypothetical protein
MSVSLRNGDLCWRLPTGVPDDEALDGLVLGDELGRGHAVHALHVAAALLVTSVVAALHSHDSSVLFSKLTALLLGPGAMEPPADEALAATNLRRRLIGHFSANHRWRVDPDVYPN